MNAFEDIVKLYLEEKGYWVRQSVKVPISKQEKRLIGLPSMPRPEIDLVALDAKKNELVLIEAKSFLDSPGVNYPSFNVKSSKLKDRYKLLNNRTFQRIVTKNIKQQYIDAGLIRKSTKIKYALAAGKVYAKDYDKIAAHFKKKGWYFFSPDDISQHIKNLAGKGWEDNVVVITSKLILK